MAGFTGKKALITGGSRGIGKAIALRLAKEGCDIAFSYFTSRNAAKETQLELKDFGANVVAVRGNIGRAGQIEKMIDSASEQLGGIDYFISNVASGVLKPTTELNSVDWQFSHDAIAKAFIDGVNHCIPIMKAAGGGKIVAMASFGADKVLQGYAAVGVAKAALASAVKYYAADLKKHSINVNAVSAGIVDTDSLKAFPNYDEMISYALANTPGGRLTRPEDVAAVVSFLLSEDADWIVGETITVDGGLTLKA